MYKSAHVIAFFLSALSLALYSMQSHDSVIELENSLSNSYKKPCCLYEGQTNSYGDKSCTEWRSCTSTSGGMLSGALVGTKILLAGVLRTHGNSCKQICCCIWTGKDPFGTGYEVPVGYCDNGTSICCTILGIGSTALAGAGLLTAACAWNPCITEKNCNKCIKKKTILPLHN